MIRLNIYIIDEKITGYDHDKTHELRYIDQVNSEEELEEWMKTKAKKYWRYTVLTEYYFTDYDDEN